MLREGEVKRKGDQLSFRGSPLYWTNLETEIGSKITSQDFRWFFYRRQLPSFGYTKELRKYIRNRFGNHKSDIDASVKYIQRLNKKYSAEDSTSAASPFVFKFIGGDFV